MVLLVLLIKHQQKSNDALAHEWPTIYILPNSFTDQAQARAQLGHYTFCITSSGVATPGHTWASLHFVRRQKMQLTLALSKILHFTT